MPVLVAAVLSLLLAAPPAGPAGASPPATAADPLWQKALALGAASDGLLPRRMTETEKLMDVDGQVIATTVGKFELTRDAQGKVARRLISATRDGKEFTERRRKDLAADPSASKEMFPRSTHVFLPENASRVEVRRTDVRAELDRVDCLAFRFTLRTDEGSVPGRAWLDEATGAPVLVEAWPTAFPEREDVRIKEMEQRFHYRVDAEGRWLLDTLEVRTAVEIKKLLDLPMKVETTLRFEGHAGARQPAPRAPP